MCLLSSGPPAIPLPPTGVCHWRQRGNQKSEEEEEEGGEGGGRLSYGRRAGDCLCVVCMRVCMCVCA